MRAKEILNEVKQRLDAKCWKGKHKEGTKIKGGVRVNNCVPNESLNEFAPDDGSGGQEDKLHKYARMWYNGDDDTQQKVETILDRMGWEIGEIESEDGGAFVVQSGDEHGKSYIGFSPDDLSEGLSEDWNKVNKKDKTDGLSQKAVNAYRRENPGSKLKTAVTTKPSKLKPGSKDAKRRKSFCARMSGNKGPMKDEKGRPTPKAKALRRWNCEENIQQLETQLDEYGDTAKGQKMLTKVQKRAVDRVTSKKADTDPKYAKKNADTADRAWDRMTDKDLEEGKTVKQEAPKPRNFVAKNAINTGAGAHKDKKKAEKQGNVKHKGRMMDLAEMEAELNLIEKASRALCTGATPDKDLGASNLASCKSQGLRARDGEKSHLITAGARKVRIKVGGKKIKGKAYGGPLPDYGTRK